MVILGGMDNVFGVIIGAVLLTILPEKFRAFEDFRLLVYGVIVVAMLMFRPQGIFPQKLRVYQDRA
jgi:branched-chain amino acid transport system permease protein